MTYSYVHIYIYIYIDEISSCQKREKCKNKGDISRRIITNNRNIIRPTFRFEASIQEAITRDKC